MDMPLATTRPKLHAWLALLRLPNLFTVPGDPLAGFVLAYLAASMDGASPAELSLPAAGLAMACALALYCAGLLLNDVFDLAEDRRDRPSRPLPSGQLRARSVVTVAVVLLAGGIGLGGLAGGLGGAVAAAALSAAVLAYNAGVKRLPIVGPLNMGVCRGISSLVGATAACGLASIDYVPVLAYAAGLTVYIAVVTALARNETRSGPVGAVRLAPPLAMAFWLLAVQWSLRMAMLACIPAMALQILAIGWTIACAQSLAGKAPAAAVAPVIGRLIRALLLVQASVAVLVSWQGMIAAGVLLLFWPVSAVLGRRFHAS